MRLATSSVPRETLSQIIKKQLDSDDLDQRLQFIRLLIQGAQYRKQNLTAGRYKRFSLAKKPETTKEYLEPCSKPTP